MAGGEFGWEKTCVADRRPRLRLGKRAVDREKRQ